MIQSGSIKSSPCPQGLHWGWVGSSIFRARPFASGTEEKKQFSAFLVRDIVIHFLEVNRDWSSYKVLGNPLELGKEEHSNASGRASQDCVHDCQGNNATVSILRYAALQIKLVAIKVKPKVDLGSSVECKEAENKDEPSKSSKRHRVTGDVHRLPIHKPWKSEAFGQDDKKVRTINCPIQLCSLIEALGIL